MKAEENITWEFCKAATEEMLGRLLHLTDEVIHELDVKHGVYLVTCEGPELSFGMRNTEAPQVIFVGLDKENSSRHFTSGFTGTSTMRRSLAALLQNALQLKAIPRSTDEEDTDRYSNYTLDEESEAKLTQWMKDHFKLAFYEYDQEQAEKLHIAMLDYNIPMLNFQNNPNNKYGSEIKKYRKECANQARLNEAALN